MSLNYTTLQTEVASYLARGNLTAKIPGFITRGENYLNSKLKLLVMEQWAAPTLLSGNRVVALGSLGTKLREIKNIFRPVGTDYEEIVKVDAFKLKQVLTENTGPPKYWDVEGGEVVRFDAIADQDYLLLAHCVLGFDLASTTTNWLIDNHEEAYLYAALAQAEPFIKNEARLPLWKSLLAEVITDIKAEDRARRGDANDILFPEISRYVGIRRAYNVFTDT